MKNLITTTGIKTIKVLVFVLTVVIGLPLIFIGFIIIALTTVFINLMALLGTQWALQYQKDQKERKIIKEKERVTELFDK